MAVLTSKWRGDNGRCLIAAVTVLGLALGVGATGAAAGTGGASGALSGFERAKQHGGPFSGLAGGAIAGLPKNVCLGDRVPQFRYWRQDSAGGFPILLGRGARSEGLNGVGDDDALFRICRPFNTGLDD